MHLPHKILLFVCLCRSREQKRHLLYNNIIFITDSPLNNLHLGNRVLSLLERCQASVGAACHSHAGSKPSPVLMACGIPEDIAINAMRLSVGRETTKEDIDVFIDDLSKAVGKLLQEQ